MASNTFPVSDAFLEEDALEQCKHLLRTKSPEDVEWDGSGLGKWHTQEGCQDSCLHDNQTINDSPFRGTKTANQSSSSPAKSLNSNENSPAKCKLADNAEDYNWDNQFDDIELCHESVESLQRSSKFKKSTRNKVKEVFQKSKDYFKSKVKKLQLFQSSNLMKGDNSQSSTQESADKGDNFVTLISKTVHIGDVKEKTQENLSEKSESQSIDDIKFIDAKSGADGKNGFHGNNNYSFIAQGCPPAVKQVHLGSDVNGNVNRENTYTNTNGHLRSSHPLTAEAHKMPGLINTKGKGDNSFEIISQEDDKEMFDMGDVQTPTESNSSNFFNMEGEDIQIKVESEEDIPLGTEANYYQPDLTNGNTEYLGVGQVLDKRLSWLLGSTDQHSFGSDFSQNTATSTSSDKSLDMLLMERTEDPEMILSNLGFGNVAEEQHKIKRIPERFLSQPSHAEGIDLQTLLEDDEDLGQILQALAEHDENLDQNKASEMTGTASPGLCNAFASVVAGMKLVSAFRSSHNQSSPNGSKDTELEMLGIQSILHPLNREWLAKQGFYDKSSTASPGKAKSSGLKLNKLVSDAAERRKRFHQSKSKQLSLTDVLESDEHELDSKTSSAMTSFDQCRSFATSIDMSCDSFDSSDSPLYSSSGRSNYRRNDSLIDDEDVSHSHNDQFKSSTSKIGNLRKNQVERLMSLEIDDGDYVLSPQSSLERTLTWQQLHGISERSNTMTSETELANQNTNGGDSFDFDNGKVNENEHDTQFKAIGFQDSTNLQTKSDHKVVEEIGVVPQSTSALESIGFKKLTLQDSVDGNDVTTGNIGRMESIHSDSSGFAEADMTAEHIIQHRILNLSPMSSAESDQTYKSGTTVLPGPGQPVSPRLMITSPLDLHTELQYIPELFANKSSQNEAQKVDKAVGTDDHSQSFINSTTSQRNNIPTVTYHVKPDKGDSGNESVSEKSLTLTIDLPEEWIKSSNRENSTNKRVVSHFYKHISPATPNEKFRSVVNFETKPQTSHGALNIDSKVSYSNSNYEPNKLLKPKWASTPRSSNVVPVRNTTPYERTNISPKKSLFHRNTELSRSVSPGESLCSETFPGFTKHPDWQDRSFQQSTESDLSDTSYVSRADSTSSLRDENIDYVKLMRLINKPVSFKRSTRGTKSSIRFKPKYNIKAWTHLDRRQHLEEETRLAQHALQRYKIELNVIETSFLVNSRLIHDELMPDEREDVEEFQHILSEVRKEIVDMEYLLANRIAGLNIGNDNFNPLLLMEIIQKMTDLLREQLFQQQLSMDKDSDEETEKPFQPTHQAPWWPEVSEQLYDIQQRVSKSPTLKLDEGLNDSLQELRHSILNEVRQELHDNTKWLHKELQHKDRELNRLKMEVMSNSMKKGHTRQKHYYESDV